jgi:hypothetical protein
MAIGGAAHATTYLLDNGGTAFGTPGNYGTVTVTGTSTDLHFDVLLNSNFTFVDTGGHYAFTGNLAISRCRRARDSRIPPSRASISA